MPFPGDRPKAERLERRQLLPIANAFISYNEPPKGNLQKKKTELYWSFTNTGVGGGYPQPIYFRFLP